MANVPISTSTAFPSTTIIPNFTNLTSLLPPRPTGATSVWPPLVPPVPPSSPQINVLESSPVSTHTTNQPNNGPGTTPTGNVTMKTNMQSDSSPQYLLNLLSYLHSTQAPSSHHSIVFVEKKDPQFFRFQSTSFSNLIESLRVKFLPTSSNISLYYQTHGTRVLIAGDDDQYFIIL